MLKFSLKQLVKDFSKSYTDKVTSIYTGLLAKVPLLETINYLTILYFNQIVMIVCSVS